MDVFIASASDGTVAFANVLRRASAIAVGIGKAGKRFRPPSIYIEQYYIYQVGIRGILWQCWSVFRGTTCHQGDVVMRSIQEWLHDRALS